MRPTDIRARLNRLAELAGGNQSLRRVLENVDLVAQEALDAETTYVNKKGDAVTFAAPQWATALAAQKLAAQLLGLTTAKESEGDGEKAGSLAAVDKRLALVGAGKK